MLNRSKKKSQGKLDKMNGNRNPIYQDLGFTVKILLRGKCIVVNAHIKKK